MKKIQAVMMVLVMSVMVLWACGIESAEDAMVDHADNEEEESLQGGNLTSGYAAVGLIVSRNGAVCTGTLIRSRVVLTAAHCVDSTLEAFYTGSGLAVDDDDGDLSDATDRMKRHAISRVAVNPDYEPYFCGNSPDLALVLLSRSSGITPARIAPETAAVPDRICTAVGFGVHGSGTSSTYARKRSGSEHIVDVWPEAVEVEWQTAIADHGDSGGPLLCGGAIAGVTSCGGAGSVRTRTVFYARPDQNLSWIHQVLRRWGV